MRLASLLFGSLLFLLPFATACTCDEPAGKFADVLVRRYQRSQAVFLASVLSFGSHHKELDRLAGDLNARLSFGAVRN